MTDTSVTPGWLSCYAPTKHKQDTTCYPNLQGRILGDKQPQAYNGTNRRNAVHCKPLGHNTAHCAAHMHIDKQ